MGDYLASYSMFTAWTTTTSKSLIVSITTAYIYYCITHLDDEIEYIWKRKWDIGKVLYLMTRYSGVSFLVFLCLTEINLIWYYSYCFSYGSFNLLESEASYRDTLSFMFTLFGGVIMIMAEVILQIRVYAIYGRNKRILSFFVLMNVISIVTCALQTSGYLDVVTNSLCVSYVFICKDQLTIVRKRDDPFTDATSSDWITHAHPMSALSWLIVTIFELLLFILVARKAKYHFWCKRRSKEFLKAHDILEVMAKDSTDYFIILFSVSAIGTIISFVAEFNYDNPGNSETNIYLTLHSFLNVYQTLAIAVMTIFAPRMLINIRSEMYNPGNLSCPASTLPWDAYHTRESFSSEEMSEF